MNLILLVLVGIIGGAVAVAAGYLWWLFTRPKKIIWQAEVYTMSDATKSAYDNEGNVRLSLHDLKPYTRDVLEKVIIDYREIYRLQKIKKTTPAVENDNIEYWDGIKRVSVLMHNDQCTLLKKGYDDDGRIIFNPIPYDTQNLIKNEMSMRKARVQQEKGLLQAVLPYVAIIFAFMFVFGVGYLVISSYMEIGKEYDKAMLEKEKMQQETAEMMRDGLIAINDKQHESAKEYRIAMNDLDNQLSRLEAILSKQLNTS